MPDYLFVGGVADGMRLPISAGVNTFKVPHKIKAYEHAWKTTGMIPPHCGAESDQYRMVIINFAYRSFALFALESLQLDEVMTRLIDNYRMTTV